MKRAAITTLAFMLYCLSSLSQNAMSSADDLARIAIAPVIQEGTDIPTSSQSLITNKMRQAISLNGLGAQDNAPLFIIYPEIAVINEGVTTSAPPMMTTVLSINLIMADKYSGTIFSNVNYELKGVGKTRDQAYLSAIRRINARDAKIKAFVAKGKEAIIEYYNSHCEIVISRAEGFAAQGDNMAALNILNSIPPVCRECYDKSISKISELGLKATTPVINSPVSDTKEEEEEVVSVEANEVYLGNDMYMTFKKAETYGKKTVVSFAVKTASEEPKDFSFSHYDKFVIIDNDGNKFNTSNFTLANKNTNKGTTIAGTPSPMAFIFDNTIKSIRLFRFKFNGKEFTIQNLPIEIK